MLVCIGMHQIAGAAKRIHNHFLPKPWETNGKVCLVHTALYAHYHSVRQGEIYHFTTRIQLSRRTCFVWRKCCCASLFFLFRVFSFLLQSLLTSLSLALLEEYCALCMTVISSAYKDDDVKCHTSRADPQGECPGSFCFTGTFCGMSHFLIPWCFLPSFFPLFQPSLHLFFFVVYFY